MMKTKLLTIAMMVALVMAAITRVQAQESEAPCLPQAHGLLGDQSAMCSSTQTIHLESGNNYISTYVEITLADLQAALLETFSGTTLTIKSQNKNIRYLPALNRWTGNLTDALFDVASMYVIVTDYEADVTLEGEPVNPADHPVTIVGDGITYLAYPFDVNKTVAEAFAGFAITGDVVKSQNQNARCVSGNTNRWSGGLSTLEPGKGYKYISNASSNRTFTFPTSK